MDRDLLVFDVNETLLDVGSLAPRFEAAFGDPSLLPVWFGLLLRNSLVASVTNRYAPFDSLAVDALNMVIRQQQLDVDESVADDVVDAMTQMPAHPDVTPALERLHQAGFRLATLTNSRHAVVMDQLAFAGIVDQFDRILSVESTRRFKPSPETYAYAAGELGCDSQALRLIAAHDWDITGAIRAGWKAAFVARPGAVLGDLGEQPDVLAGDLGALATQLINDAGR